MRLIESILLKGGIYHNLDLHQKRMDHAFRNYAPNIESHDLTRILPKLDLNETYKVRLVYDLDTEDAEYNIEFAVYSPRKIESLEVVESSPFDYSMKFENRDKINSLVKRTNMDDIIIEIDKEVTDGSYFNLAFWDGSNWYTPSSYLLNGIRRQLLLRDKKIKERTILTTDLSSFEKVSLINAMLDLEELEVHIESIKY